MTKTKKFLIIDANSLIHRAYHALPPLTTKDGKLVNAVYGFANIYLKVLREHKPDYVAVCFDVAGGTFRDEIYSEYKAGREKKPQEFYDQFDIIKDLLKTFKAQVYEKKGFEADDLIGTLSQKVKSEKLKVKSIVLSGDKDMLQLIDTKTEVEIVKKGVSETLVYTPKTFQADFGFAVASLIDYKALRGDPSDNIPGVKGVGEKTATDLILKFKTIENIYNILKDTKTLPDTKESVINKLQIHKKDAYLSKKLVTIKTDVPLKFKLNDVEVSAIDYEKAVELIQSLGFKSLLNRLPKPETGSLFSNNSGHPGGVAKATIGSQDSIAHSRSLQNDKKNTKYILINSDEKFKKFLVELSKQKIFAFDTETTSLDVVTAELIGMSFSWKKGEGYYLPYENLKPKIKDLKAILENPEVGKTGHNIKYDYQILKQHSISLGGIKFDSMIASYLINPGSRSHSLDALAFQEFGHQMIPISDLIGSGPSSVPTKVGTTAGEKDEISMHDVPIEKISEYACEDADYTWQLYKKLSENKNLKHVNKVFQDIEIPLISILGDMELRGIEVDAKFLNKFSKKLSDKIESLEIKIWKLAGERFNVASPMQLKDILFNKLHIPTDGLSRTKTGVSTSAQDLEKMYDRHKIIKPILEFRELSKLQNTYANALPKLINEKTGRVHTSFNQTIAATGRLSSSNPNLQNIPIRTELGREIRKAFIARKGYSLVVVDYSQIELRVVASLADETNMIKAFKEGEDIHTKTASEIYDISIDKVTSQQRREAKEVNFGVLFGLGARGISQRAQIPHARAKEIYDRYFELRPGLKKYITSVIEFARDKGYTETLFGRRRYFPEINVEHPAMRAQAERMAINLPIQGTEADIMKLAMIKVVEEINKQNLQDKIKLLLQVHDELVFEIKDSFVKKASLIIKEAMENVAKLKVPIMVDIGVGKNWKEAK